MLWPTYKKLFVIQFPKQSCFYKAFPHCNHISTGIITRNDHINNWVSERAMTPLAVSFAHPEPPPLWWRQMDGQYCAQGKKKSFIKGFVKIRQKKKVPGQSEPLRKLGIEIYKSRLGLTYGKHKLWWALFQKILIQNTTSERARVRLLQLFWCYHCVCMSSSHIYLLSDSSGKLM